jgi:hypothetical protein
MLELRCFNLVSICLDVRTPAPSAAALWNIFAYRIIYNTHDYVLEKIDSSMHLPLMYIYMAMGPEQPGQA